MVVGCRWHFRKVGAEGPVRGRARGGLKTALLGRIGQDLIGSVTVRSQVRVGFRNGSGGDALGVRASW